MLEKYKYHFLLHFIILLWGFTGILGKLIHLDFYSLVWHRLLIAIIGLSILMFLWKKPLQVISLKQMTQLAIVGILVGLHWVTFYKSIQLSTASLGILCLSTTTLHVTWLEPLVMKRKFSWTEFALGLLVIGGIYIVSGNFNPRDYEALAYGLLSALFAALFAVFNGQLVQSIPSSTMTFYELLMSFLFLSSVLLFQGRLNTSLFEMSGSDFAWLLFLGLICTSFAFMVMIDLVKRLGAFTVSLSINMEPVYTILLAIVLLHENELLGAQFYWGALIIVVIVLANPIIKHLQKKG